PSTVPPPPPAPTLPPASAGTCPAAPPYAAPAPDRPVYGVVASVDVAAGVVDGTVTVRFTPDLPVDALVVRLWANSPRPATTGASTTIGPVTDLDRGVALATAQPDPTLVDVSLGRVLEAGEDVTVSIPFRVQVGGSVRDRISHSGDTLRLGSFIPLLAWEPGVGWAREPPTSAFAEAATLPAADWSLQLAVPPGYDVLASGRRGGDGTWRISGARDVAVSIGHFATVTAVEALPGPVEVTVGVDASVGEDPQAYLQRVVDSLRAHSARFGPYPYESYTLAVTPDLNGGIEFPGHVMQGPGSIGRTTSHEVAHQWFYALVGNDQGRDPWLDEGLASYAEFRHEATLDAGRARTIPAGARGQVGQPMTYWEGHQDSYYRGVYVQGAVALASLGDVELVDCALRLYVATNAFRIARPADLLAALAVVFPDAAARLAAYGIA
ncbi:MAG: hypothetical protein H0W25_14640, partial [Acidimicrobiia bacterium]|nr:hypothetical protein [Acidimicrobiia bacterium]